MFARFVLPTLLLLGACLGAKKNPNDASIHDAATTPPEDLALADLTLAATHDLADSDGSSTTPSAYCTGNTKAILCDDFSDATKTAAQFTSKVATGSTLTEGTSNPVLYKNGPTLRVHMAANAGSAYLDGTLSKTLTTLYGRVRLYVAPIGSASGWPMDHTNFVSGIAANGQYSVDEQFQQLSSVSVPESGGVHFIYPGCVGSAASCASTAWPSGKWLCLEWEFTNSDVDFYNNGRGGTPAAYWEYNNGAAALLTDQFGTEPQFQLLSGFTSVQLGGILFGNDSSQAAAFDFYFANFAIGSTRFDDCASDE